MVDVCAPNRKSFELTLSSWRTYPIAWWRGTRLSIESRLQFCQFISICFLFQFILEKRWFVWKKGEILYFVKKFWFLTRTILNVKLLSSLFLFICVRWNIGLASFPEVHGNWSVNFCKVFSVPPCPIKHRNIYR